MLSGLQRVQMLIRADRHSSCSAFDSLLHDDDPFSLQFHLASSSESKQGPAAQREAGASYQGAPSQKEDRVSAIGSAITTVTCVPSLSSMSDDGHINFEQSTSATMFGNQQASDTLVTGFSSEPGITSCSSFRPGPFNSFQNEGVSTDKPFDLGEMLGVLQILVLQALTCHSGSLLAQISLVVLSTPCSDQSLSNQIPSFTWPLPPRALRSLPRCLPPHHTCLCPLELVFSIHLPLTTCLSRHWVSGRTLPTRASWQLRSSRTMASRTCPPSSSLPCSPRCPCLALSHDRPP